MNKRLWVLLLGILVSLATHSCTATDGPEHTRTPFDNDASDTPHATFSKIPNPVSSTLTLPTITSAPISVTQTMTTTVANTVTPLQMDEMIPSCLNDGVPLSLPEDFGLDDSIVYQDSDLTGLYSVGGEPLVFSSLPVSETQKYENMGFSPDGYWLAYSPERENFEDTFENPIIILLASDGTVIEHTVDISSFTSHVPDLARLIAWRGNWINNELLYIGLLYQFPEGDTYIGSLYGILDPFQGIWLDAPLSNLDLSTPIGYSPDMTRVLYPTDEGMVLWDLNQQRQIWTDSRGFSVAPPGPMYDWSADSVIAGYMSYLDRKVILISRDGEFLEEIPEILSINSSMRYPINGFSFSPDGLSVALTVNRYDQEAEIGTSMLYIYNITQKQYTYRCPFFGYPISPPERMFWSPDGNYIIPDTQFWPMPLLVFDFRTGKVFELAEEAGTGGVSDQFPAVWP